MLVASTRLHRCMEPDKGAISRVKECEAEAGDGTAVPGAGAGCQPIAASILSKVSRDAPSTLMQVVPTQRKYTPPSGV